MANSFIRVVRKASVAELLAQLPFEMCPEVTKYFGQFMKTRFDDRPADNVLLFSFNPERLMEPVYATKYPDFGFMPETNLVMGKIDPHYGLSWYIANGYKQVKANTPPSELSCYEKFQLKCKELGYTKIGKKKYRNPQGHVISFKEQHVSGGTRPMWTMAWLNSENIVYCGEAAAKIASSFNAVMRTRFIPLKDFLGRTV